MYLENHNQLIRGPHEPAKTKHFVKNHSKKKLIFEGFRLKGQKSHCVSANLDAHLIPALRFYKSKQQLIWVMSWH